jgi:hypothetical protein
VSSLSPDLGGPGRTPLLHLPEFRRDVRLLPRLFLHKPRVWIPLVLVLVGLAVFIALPNLPLGILALAGYYIQFFFAPPALFTFFIVGILAPRASYLFGFVYGIVAGIAWSIAVLSIGVPAVDPTRSPLSNTYEPLFVIANMLVIGVLYGTLGAALAGLVRYLIMSAIRPRSMSSQSRP